MQASLADLSLSWQLVVRNALYQRRAWLAVVTAVIEPVLYFAAVVVGFSSMLPSQHGSYVSFAGPALLAVSVMNGAVVECTNNVYFRWRQARLYDSVVCTALSPGHIVIGDLIFGSLRGWAYGAAFLVLLVSVVHLSVPSVLAMLVAGLAVGFMFAALGLSVVGYIGSMRQLQLAQLATFAMILMSDTFLSLSDYGPVAAAGAHLLPLTYANELMRSLARQQWGSAAVDLAVVLAIGVVATAAALRSISRKMAG